MVVIIALTVGIALAAGGDSTDTPTSSEATPWTAEPTSTASPTRDAQRGQGQRGASGTGNRGTVGAEPEISDDEIADQSFVAYVKTAGDFPYFSTVPDEQLISLGRALCGDLDDGFDPYALAFQISGDLDADEIEAAALVGAAMGSYCPRHQSAW